MEFRFQFSIIHFVLLIWDVFSKVATTSENLIFVLKGQVPEFVPEVVVDVGANRGKYSAFLRRMYPTTSILLLEADPMHQESLKKFCHGKEGVEYQIVLLSSHSDESVPWYGGGNTGNSMFREQSELYQQVVPVMKQSQTLDQVVSQSHVVANRRVGIIKIDVQGAELLVLRGGTETLKQATFVQIEASTVRYNDGGSCTWEVDEFLRSQGYALYEMGDKRYSISFFRTPGLGQFDLIYVNTHNMPESLRNASYCAGTKSSIPYMNLDTFERSVNIASFTDSKYFPWDKLVIFIVGLSLGYVVCLLQSRNIFLTTKQRAE
jgi:FkbM family methyltransferase